MRDMTLGTVLLVMLGFWLLVFVAIRFVPVLRHGRTVTLSHPRPCSMHEAQRFADRLIADGFDAEVVEHDDNGMNMWANTKAGGEVRPDERYVVRVPRKQATAVASRT
jgi:hypothetical protein